MEHVIKLIIVDDESRFLEAIATRLRKRGFDVRTATNGRDAIALAKDEKFDIALLDLKMPGMDGSEVLRVLKSEHEYLEAIILTGHGSLESAVELTKLGAFSYLRNRKCFFWSVIPVENNDDVIPGTVISSDPLVVRCGQGAIQLLAGQSEGGVYVSGAQLAAELNLVPGLRFSRKISSEIELKRKKTVLILGVDGFIGNHLSEHLLDSGKYEVHGMDLGSSSIKRLLSRPGFHFSEGDISIHREWIEYHVRKCDIVLPLVAIATPAEYVRNPLRVFELDFEENLRIVRYCHKYGKRILFPSTSEVYGMSQDPEFNEETSNFVLGPIHKQRWIYSCSKQMLDRVIWAYGATKGLQFTLPSTGLVPGWTA